MTTSDGALPIPEVQCIYTDSCWLINFLSIDTALDIFFSKSYGSISKISKFFI